MQRRETLPRPRPGRWSTIAKETAGTEATASPSPGDQPSHASDVLNDFSAKLPAKRMDQVLDRIAFDLFPPTIDAILQLAARQDRTRSNQQRSQKAEFPCGQASADPVASGLTGRGVERKPSVGKDRA